MRNATHARHCMYTAARLFFAQQHQPLAAAWAAAHLDWFENGACSCLAPLPAAARPPPKGKKRTSTLKIKDAYPSHGPKVSTPIRAREGPTPQ